MTTTRITTADRDALIRKLMAENPGLPAMKMTDLIKDALGIGKERAYHYYRQVVHAGVEGRQIRDRSAEKAEKVAPEPKPAKVKAEKAPKAPKATKPAKSAEEVAAAKAKNLAAIKAAAEKAGKVQADKDPAASTDEVEAIMQNILGDDKIEDIVPKFLQKDLGLGEFRADAE